MGVENEEGGGRKWRRLLGEMKRVGKKCFAKNYEERGKLHWGRIGDRAEREREKKGDVFF